MVISAKLLCNGTILKQICAKIVRKLCENCAKILFALLYYSNKFLYNNEIILSRYTVILFLPISLLQSKLR